jgi:L-amino acid N-acyltransferase YncA
VLEEEYAPRRRLPRHLQPEPVPEPAFEYAIREALITDLPDVREIFAHYVENSSITLADRSKSLQDWRRLFAMLTRLRLPFLVAETPSQQVIGYALAEPWQHRANGRATVEVSIYLRPASTGKGLGRVLLAELVTASRAAGVREMLAVIADRKAEGSVVLHQRAGFAEIGRMGRVGFKYDRWLGSVMLSKRLSEADGPGPERRGLFRRR